MKHPIQLGGNHLSTECPARMLTPRIGSSRPCGDYLRSFWTPPQLPEQLGWLFANGGSILKTAGIAMVNPKHGRIFERKGVA